MDKIHKFSPIIKQKFGLVFGGHYKLPLRNATLDFTIYKENFNLNKHNFKYFQF